MRPATCVAFGNRVAGAVTSVNYHERMAGEPDDLVDASEVAPMIGLANPKGVAVYRKREGLDFPEPWIVKGRCVLWRRQDIEAWAVDHPRRGSRA